MAHHLPDPYKALPLDERIRQAEQAVIDRDERVHRYTQHLTGRWHAHRLPSVAQGAGAGLLAGLGSFIVRRAFAARPALRHRGSGSARLDLVLQFLPLLLPVLPAHLQRWVKPSRLILGLTLAAPLFAIWQARQERERAQAEERALIRQVIEEQRRGDALQGTRTPPDDDDVPDDQAPLVAGAAWQDTARSVRRDPSHA